MKKNYSTVNFMNENYRDWFYRNWIGTHKIILAEIFKINGDQLWGTEHTCAGQCWSWPPALCPRRTPPAG